MPYKCPPTGSELEQCIFELASRTSKTLSSLTLPETYWSNFLTVQNKVVRIYQNNIFLEIVCFVLPETVVQTQVDVMLKKANKRLFMLKTL